ncbi:MAG TPA: protein phosphatase 2C domain-containing protein, partial [Nannocystaceae bacterium]|nr:protein phosphatase 2C domain-containing protein [Nannocystaceae bacterium]
MSISFLDNGLRIRFSGKSDIGRVRDHNEDDVLLPSEIPIAAGSDGMGGHACGEVASHLAVETVDNYYARTVAESPPNWPFRMPQLQIERDRMTAAIKLANTRIHETGLGDPSKKGMGCTIDAIYFSQGRCYIGHVGDSRVYKIKGGQITQLTEDHSLLNDYRRMREMSGDDIDNFGYKNVVVRALGLSEHVFVDVLVDDYHRGDIYVLCSDGLSGMLADPVILQTCTRFESLDTATNTLVNQANEAGGVDNISAVLVRIEQG